MGVERSRIRNGTFSRTIFILLLSIHIYLPMKMEQTECSETSAYKIQMPGNYPKESIQHTEHGESLKSRIQMFCVVFSIFHRAADNVFPISVIVFYKSASELPTQAL